MVKSNKNSEREAAAKATELKKIKELTRNIYIHNNITTMHYDLENYKQAMEDAKSLQKNANELAKRLARMAGRPLNPVTLETKFNYFLSILVVLGMFAMIVWLAFGGVSSNFQIQPDNAPSLKAPAKNELRLLE